MKNLLKLSLVFLISIIALPLFAANVQTVNVESPSMKKEIPALVILPDSYETSGKNYPVIYLLHGFGGNYRMWFDIRPDLQKIASDKDVIFVLSDGATSWYWDSPINENLKYETFTSKELVNFVDKNYRTIKSPKGRAITGLSMGGQGALFLALNHPDIFGAAGSTSGGVDIRPFPKNWDMSKNIGEYENNKSRWNEFAIIEKIDSLKPNDLALIIDCGTEDFFYQVNENIHKKLLSLKIPHDYITRPGVHNGEYWKNSIDYQILFFKKFFERK